METKPCDLSSGGRTQQGETESCFPCHMPPLLAPAGSSLQASAAFLQPTPEQARSCCTPTCRNCSVSRRNKACHIESEQPAEVKEVNTRPPHSSPSTFSFFRSLETLGRTCRYLVFRERGKPFPFLISL